MRRAAVRLGAQATRDVLYQGAYASVFVDTGRYRDLIEAVFEHGVRVGQHARLLARELGVDGDIAFLAGLLHDIGRARCWKLLARLPGPIGMVEGVDAVDQTHTTAGAELAAAWNLPDEVVEACRWHHDAGRRTYPRLIAAADAVACLAEGRGAPDYALVRLLDAGVSEVVSRSLLDAVRAGRGPG